MNTPAFLIIPDPRRSGFVRVARVFVTDTTKTPRLRLKSRRGFEFYRDAQFVGSRRTIRAKINAFRKHFHRLGTAENAPIQKMAANVPSR